MFGAGGVGREDQHDRLESGIGDTPSTTRPRPHESSDPVASKSDPTATAPPGPTTTTTAFAVTPEAATTSTTTTTIPACGSSATTATVLVVNASHVIGTAKWWRDELAANVPSVDFAEPANALAQESSSRVLAVAGYECEAGLVAAFTVASTVEQATIEGLQSLVAQPLPAGTSIIVLVGDDNMSKFTTGVTTTING